MFTIEVKKKEKDEEFDFTGLDMFHQECYGGQIFVRDNLSKCSRCGITSKVVKRVILGIIKTAIDGKERKFEKPIKGYDGDILWYDYNITVIQKT